MVRKVLAVVIGIVAGSAFNMAMVSASHAMFPFPESVDPNDFESVKAHVEAHGMATGALIMVIVAHAGGSLVSGFVCGLIGQAIMVSRRCRAGHHVGLRRPCHADDASGTDLVCRNGHASVHTGRVAGRPTRRCFDGQQHRTSRHRLVTIVDETSCACAAELSGTNQLEQSHLRPDVETNAQEMTDTSADVHAPAT